MKTLIKDYAFNKTGKQVVFLGDDCPESIEEILLITNVTRGEIIYNFADKLSGGTLAGNVLTLNRDTTAMNDADSLQIFTERDGVVDGLNELARTVNTLKKALGLPDIYGRLRINVESGTLPTVTTVGTVNNQAAMGGYQTTTMNMSMTNASAQNLRGKITVS